MLKSWTELWKYDFSYLLCNVFLSENDILPIFYSICDPWWWSACMCTVMQSHEDDDSEMLAPIFKQHLPPNGKVMQAADIGEALITTKSSFHLFWQFGL